MTEINQRLREFTTQIAFHLTLSRQMIGRLQEIKLRQMLADVGLSFYNHTDEVNDARKQVPDIRNFIAADRALEARGLITMTPNWEKVWNQPLAMPARLSPAGEHVFELLIMAGVVNKLSIPANAQMKQRRRA